MLVSLKHRVVVFAMPKCASTAFESAFGGHMDVMIGGVPSAKHTPFRKYERFLKKYFESFTEGPLETVCLFRDPVDWLGSWWRYRGRDALDGKPNSTREMDFDAFVRAYLDGVGAAVRVGRQAQFVSDRDGAVGIDRIWRYDHVEDCAAWLAARLGVSVTLGRENVSPGPHLANRLSPDTRERMMHELTRDFQIYDSAR